VAAVAETRTIVDIINIFDVGNALGQSVMPDRNLADARQNVAMRLNYQIIVSS